MGAAALSEKQAVRRQLESTRRSYHELLSSIDEGAWRKKSGNPEMTVKELMWHMAWAMGWMGRSVDGIKQGKDLRLPAFLVEPGRKLAMRWLARSATPQKAARAYDEGHAQLLARLESTPEEDWSIAAERFGEMRTVGWCFQHPADHFEEHARDVRAALPVREGV